MDADGWEPAPAGETAMNHIQAPAYEKLQPSSFESNMPPSPLPPPHQ